MRMRILSLAALLAAAACATAPRGTAVPAQLDAPFQLPRGQTAAVGGEPLTVTFTSVASDSRCPANVQCIRAGEAKVHLELHARGQAEEDVILSTEGGQPRYATYGRYDVHLVALEPQPRTDAPRPRYVATLRVTRR